MSSVTLTKRLTKQVLLLSDISPNCSTAHPSAHYLDGAPNLFNTTMPHASDCPLPGMYSIGHSVLIRSTNSGSAVLVMASVLLPSRYAHASETPSGSTRCSISHTWLVISSVLIERCVDRQASCAPILIERSGNCSRTAMITTSVCCKIRVDESITVAV
jgi:hypothetical protein